MKAQKIVLYHSGSIDSGRDIRHGKDALYLKFESRYGVAQLTGCNASGFQDSSLLLCLLAVESFMGKKTQSPSPN
ncbi:hypothetical protein MLD38_026259 [Melastoma candidum]|uniref:Uncharacterized protein n=1 Tax=Melastoma candidum TaxID=119954 RepID=A0ACB9NY09_9MYRT|nr:hypothetical protein MLD38_026259 [Melastoma candidum]